MPQTMNRTYWDVRERTAQTPLDDLYSECAEVLATLLTQLEGHAELWELASEATALFLRIGDRLVRRPAPEVR